MPRIQDTEEVRILRFFEEGPLEKAELLYNIIAQKMRARLAGSPEQQPRRSKHGSEPERKEPGTA